MPTPSIKPAATVPKQTLVTAAYDRLRRDIQRGVLRPGERLRLQQLGETYQCGTGALREALSRLVGDSMVAFEDRRGFSVPLINEKHLTDLLELRMVLEERALRESIARGGVEWEVDVMSAFHRLSRAGEQRKDPRIVSEDWEREHGAFHRALVGAYDFPLMHQLRETVNAQFDRYRHVYIQYASRGRDHLAEHREIMEVALRRNADETVRLTRKHLKKTVDLLLAAGFPQDRELTRGRSRR